MKVSWLTRRFWMGSGWVLKKWYWSFVVALAWSVLNAQMVYGELIGLSHGLFFNMISLPLNGFSAVWWGKGVIVAWKRRVLQR